MNLIEVAQSLRLAIRELLGSRLVERLELDLVHLRSDFEQRLQDQSHLIASLREEKQLLMSKLTTYELTIMPHSSRMGAEVVAYQKPTKPNFSFVDVPAPKSKWEAFQEQYYKEEAEKDKAAAAASKE
jgi:hypothetical protein